MIAIRLFFLAIPLLLLCSCAGGIALVLNLRLDSPAGVQPGSPIVLGGQAVGQVTSVEPEAAGGYIARLTIAPEFRDRATQTARFVVSRDPDNPDRTRIVLEPGTSDAPPLADGATVQASIDPALLFPLDEIVRGLTQGLGALRDQVEGFRTQLERLRGSEESRRLRDEWIRLRDELWKAQEVAEESVRKELIPKLQQEIDTLEKRLRELDGPIRD